MSPMPASDFETAYETLATAIRIGDPVSWPKALHEIRSSEGVVEKVIVCRDTTLSLTPESDPVSQAMPRSHASEYGCSISDNKRDFPVSTSTTDMSRISARRASPPANDS